MNGIPKYYKDSIAKICKAVADYHEGLARIDREFDAACNRIEQSLLNLNGDATKNRTRLNEQEAQHLANEKKQATANREKRKSNWQLVFSKEWEKITDETARSGLQIRRHQPAFVDFGSDNPLMTEEFPVKISLGSHRISFEQFFCFIPYSVPFPLTRTLVLPGDDAAQKDLARHLLLRLVSALPPGQLELTLIDPLQLGQSVRAFLSLLKVEQLVCSNVCSLARMKSRSL